MGKIIPLDPKRIDMKRLEKEIEGPRIEKPGGERLTKRYEGGEKVTDRISERRFSQHSPDYDNGLRGISEND